MGPDPRQHELAVALREIGRVERTLFIIDWLLDTDMQRRAQIGLNKGEARQFANKSKPLRSAKIVSVRPDCPMLLFSMA